MSKLLKRLKGYNDNEITISNFLSAAPTAPSEEELRSMFKLYTSTSRNFLDLNLVLNRHIVALDNAVKFYRAILLTSYTLEQLYPLRNEGVCEDLADLDLPDNKPIPPASLFLYLRVQLLESIDTLIGVQYWGKRVEVAQSKKAALASAHPQPAPKPAPKASARDSSQTELLSGRSSENGGEGLPFSQTDPPSQNSSSTLHSSLLSDEPDDPSRYLTPPGVFIEGLYDLLMKYQISIQGETQKFIAQIQSYSLSTDTSGHSRQHVDIAGDAQQEPQQNVEPPLPSKPPPKILSKRTAEAPQADQPDELLENNKSSSQGDAAAPLAADEAITPSAPPPRLKDKKATAGEENGGFVLISDPEPVQPSDEQSDLVVFDSHRKAKKH